MAGDELHGLERTGPGDPDLGVGLLHGPRPRVHVANAEVLADELEGPRLGPRLEYEIVGLLEALTGVGRVDGERVVLRPAADDHAGDEPTTADDVDHGELFGDARGRVVQRQGVADDGDAHP